VGVGSTVYPNDGERQKGWMKVHKKRLLDKEKIERLVGVLRAIESDSGGNTSLWARASSKPDAKR
jgi:hypothetical protein